MTERDAITEALKFYADEWQGNMIGDGETPGLSHCFQEPTKALLEDEGRRAREVYRALTRAEGGKEMPIIDRQCLEAVAVWKTPFEVAESINCTDAYATETLRRLSHLGLAEHYRGNNKFRITAAGQAALTARSQPASGYSKEWCMDAARIEDDSEVGVDALDGKAEPAMRLVPLVPTEDQWGGLARDIVMWSRFAHPHGRALFTHLGSKGRAVPQWLRDEIPDTEHVPPKGTVAAAIYRAMVEASPFVAPAQPAPAVDPARLRSEDAGKDEELVRELREPIPFRKATPAPLRVPGCGRDAENDKALCFYFSRAVTDDELRFLHEVMQRSCACMPKRISNAE